jgi:hypothetical protein
VDRRGSFAQFSARRLRIPLERLLLFASGAVALEWAANSEVKISASAKCFQRRSEQGLLRHGIGLTLRRVGSSSYGKLSLQPEDWRVGKSG